MVVLLPLMLLSPQLISLFNQEPEVLRYGTLFIRFISPFYLVICINRSSPVRCAARVIRAAAC